MRNWENILRKILLYTFLVLLFSISVNAADIESLKYKNLENNQKIIIENSIWSNKVSKKDKNYLIKKVPDGITNYTEFYSPDGDFLFSTGTHYEFIHNGMLIGYSNYDLKFYEYSLENNILVQRELSYDEVKELFPKYNIIKISDFSKETNSLKIKKNKRNYKLLLLNDTDRYFYNYKFTTNNSKFKNYQLKSFLLIQKKGMIQFSAFGENTKDKPWYVLLIR